MGHNISAGCGRGEVGVMEGKERQMKYIMRNHLRKRQRKKGLERKRKGVKKMKTAEATDYELTESQRSYSLRGKN